MTNPGVTNGQPDSRIDEPDGTRGWLIEGTFVPQGDSDRYPGDYGAITEIAAPFVARASSSCARHATGRSPASGRSTAASTPTLSSSSTTTCPRHARAVPTPRSCSKSP